MSDFILIRELAELIERLADNSYMLAGMTAGQYEPLREEFKEIRAEAMRLLERHLGGPR